MHRLVIGECFKPDWNALKALDAELTLSGEGVRLEAFGADWIVFRGIEPPYRSASVCFRNNEDLLGFINTLESEL